MWKLVNWIHVVFFPEILGGICCFFQLECPVLLRVKIDRSFKQRVERYEVKCQIVHGFTILFMDKI